MVTLVGTQNKLIDALKSLLELEHDAIEAYEAAISRLENQEYRAKITEFRDDHHRHIKELSSLFQKHDLEIEAGPSVKQYLAKGKVVLAELLGDNTVLKAMLSNEEDTNEAYKTMTERKDIWDDLQEVLNQAYEDEKKHKNWLEEVIQD